MSDNEMGEWPGLELDENGDLPEFSRRTVKMRRKLYQAVDGVSESLGIKADVFIQKAVEARMRQIGVTWWQEPWQRHINQ